MKDIDVGLLDTLSPAYSRGKRHSLKDRLIPVLSIIWHENPDMIGAIAPLEWDNTLCARLSRLQPVFQTLREEDAASLNDARVSRSDILIEKLTDRQFAFTPPESPMSVKINKTTITKRTIVELDAKGEDIIITLSGRISLSLFMAPVSPATLLEQKYGLFGISPQIARIRNHIGQVSKSALNVMIYGETGTGKEVVAQALHAHSQRAARKMLAVNMAGLTPSLATSELFGVKKGAYTGADCDTRGFLEEAHGSSLFLDEIGDTTPETQTMLLRAIETGIYRRLGDDQDRAANIRFIAATDKQLGTEAQSEDFNQPLRMRLEGDVLRLPPLRHRRSDIGLLVKAFLQEKRSDLPHIDIKDVSPFLIFDMIFYDWPGNVRELRNAVHKIRCGIPVSFEASDAQKSGDTKSLPKRRRRQQYRHPSSISEKELIDALNRSQWVIKDAAAMLGVSRPALYDIMARSSKVREINDIRPEEIRRIMKAFPGDIGSWARQLHVGRESLKKRIRTLQLDD